MPNQATSAIDNDHFAEITAFLASGGTVAQANKISEAALESVYSMAYNQYTNGHYEEAAKGFQYLCFYDQWNPRNFLCLGACQQMLRVYGQAIQTYLFAFKLDPASPLPLAYVADCHMALNKTEKAAEIYQAALKLAEETGFTHKEISRAETMLTAINVPDREVH